MQRKDKRKELMNRRRGESEFNRFLSSVFPPCPLRPLWLVPSYCHCQLVAPLSLIMRRPLSSMCS